MIHFRLLGGVLTVVVGVDTISKIQNEMFDPRGEIWRNAYPVTSLGKICTCWLFVVHTHKRAKIAHFLFCKKQTPKTKTPCNWKMGIGVEARALNQDRILYKHRNNQRQRIANFVVA